MKDLLMPWYAEIKFAHLIFVAIWAFSTAVAYQNYVLPAFRKAFANPDDADAIAHRNRMIEAFDRGVVLEHVAFPMVLLTGLTLLWLGGWSPETSGWLAAKLALVLLVFIPMEIVDYRISHFSRPKREMRLAGDMESYEAAVAFHWRFLRVSTVLVVTTIPAAIFLAVVKPF
ncbi:putative membrane protein [Parvibaculum indicum]|uniref:hypothetical protein n=1 Tax=Parvibaculum indicum TaxID=562969 RepID=UPI001423CA78|nr:hypothetical protein [Parvibaculum indicum]NIJ40816.1 putative membrane protein [Parvibaculum indicum]